MPVRNKPNVSIIIIFAVLLGLILCISPVSAWLESFEGATSFTYSTGTSGGHGSATARQLISNTTPNWNFSMGGDSGSASYPVTGIVSLNPYPNNLAPTQFFAWTDTNVITYTGVGIYPIYILFYDNSGNYINATPDISTYIVNNKGSRFWLQRNGANGQIDLWQDGSDVWSGISYTAITPSTFAFEYTVNNGGGQVANASLVIDDIVAATTADGYVISGIPTSWYIQHDTLGYSVDGVYNGYGNVANTTYMETTWGSLLGGVHTINLLDPNGIVRQSQTVSGYSGVADFNIASFVASGAPYGVYTLQFSGSTDKDTQIQYISTGATVAFNQRTYSQSDTMNITYSISTQYYSPNIYTYKLAIQNTYGQYVSNTSLTNPNGSVLIPLTNSSFTQGVYFAEIVATPNDGGDIIMTMDYATVTSYVYFTGYVLNAETAAPFSAHINLTQGTSTQTVISAANGTWSSSNNWVIGAPIYIDTEPAGYYPTLINFTPQVSREIPLNLSVMPLNRSCVGVCIGGLVTDNAYHIPLANAGVIAINTTNNYSSSIYTNVAGYYVFNDLNNFDYYDVTASLLGYQNVTHQIQAIGV